MDIAALRRHGPNRIVFLTLTAVALTCMALADAVLVASAGQGGGMPPLLVQWSYPVLLWRMALMGLVAAGSGVFFAALVAYTYRNMALEEKNLHLETQVKRTQKFTTRLVQLNRELDEFTYAVSHDLKEPLRGVEGVTRMLLQEYGDKLEPAPRECVQSIRDSGTRMSRLVNELLRLSRISRCKYPREEVDFNELLAETLRALEYACGQKFAKVHVQPDLPVLKCDRVRMAEVFHNLISNALKFAGDKPPVIEVGHRMTPREHVFWVRDGGIGIRAEDQGRVFEAFHRVNSSREGTGIGLTICKRIIESHGGRIWVESQFGVGSCFHFALPMRAQASGAARIIQLEGDVGVKATHIAG